MPFAMLVEPRAATQPMSAELVGAAAYTRTGNKKATTSRNDFMCDLRSIVDDTGEAMGDRAIERSALCFPAINHAILHVGAITASAAAFEFCARQIEAAIMPTQLLATPPLCHSKMELETRFA